MSIDEIVKKRLNDAIREYNERLDTINKELNTLKVRKENLSNFGIPEDTGLLDKIKNLNNKEVEVTYSDGITVDGVLSYANGRINVDVWSTPIFSDHENYLDEIVDKQTNEVVYHNNFKEIGDLYFQYAWLYGRKPVLEYIDKQQNMLKQNLIGAQKFFDQAVENISNLQDRIEEMLYVGEMIYPQLQQKWREFVYTSAEDSINFYITNNAFEIMKALHEGKTVEEAKSLIDDGHSGSSFSFMLKEILEFSKRGVEFYKSNNDEKYFDDKTKDYLKDIEERNKKFEQEQENTIGL